MDEKRVILTIIYDGLSNEKVDAMLEAFPELEATIKEFSPNAFISIEVKEASNNG